MNIPAIVAPARLKSVAMLCVFLSMTIGRLKAGARLLNKPYRKADLAKAVRTALGG